MSEQKSFVAGFLFTADLKFVAMVRKAKTELSPNCPDWQVGKLNAVGGKQEPGECNDMAMSREFHEEAGVLITTQQWHRYALIEFPDAIVQFFCARLGSNPACYLTTDPRGELVGWYPVERLLEGRYETMENIPAMLLLALHYFDFCDTGKHK